MLEFATFVAAFVYVALLAAGVVPWTVLAKVYLLSVAPVELNAMRDFTAHRFERFAARSHAEQLTDSFNIVGRGPASYLLYPIGSYHELHHLFPTMPYHNMAAAHRLLMEQLPSGSPYRATNRNSFLQAAGELLRQTIAHTRQPARETTRG